LKWVCFISCALLPLVALAAETPAVTAPVHIDLRDQASLQRGARMFVNYCLSCHSAAYMRYNRMGHDLEIPEPLLKEDLMFASDKTGDLMQVAMPAEDGKEWFNVAPPDLTLVTRYRGAQWVYDYLHGFYRDETTSTGWNNVVFPNVAMPNVLYLLQGTQRAVFQTKPDGTKVFDHFELQRPGSMDAQEYDNTVRDLTNFLVYLGEPARLVRYRIGAYTLIFLAVFFVFVYLLKKEYWKDVH
jgi:ubiquinol-cytochrome c reductase cytochrome c1 subunit